MLAFGLRPRMGIGGGAMGAAAAGLALRVVDMRGAEEEGEARCAEFMDGNEGM